MPIFNEIAAIQYNIFSVFNYFSEHNELYYGAMHLKGFSILLPGHQIDMSLFLKDKLGLFFEGGGLPPTIIGQIYIDFGLYGLFIEGIFLGFIVSFIFEYLLFKSNKAYLVHIYMYLLSYFIYVIRNGLFYSHAILFAVLYLYIYRYFYYGRSKCLSNN
jgi:hypothetical protein